MTKKAIFYTTAAIALTIVIIVTYSAYNEYKLSENMDVVQTRIETVNFFIKNVEKNIGNGAFVAGFKTFSSFNDYINDNDAFIDDVDARFEESFVDGTISGLAQDLMRNYTFKEWVNKISAEANKIDIIFNATINDIKITQSEPWNVDIVLNLTLNVRDKRNTSYWNKEKYFIQKMGIAEIKDPLYTYNNNGVLNNTIRKTNITSFVVNGKVANLLYHTNNSFYTAHSDAPSFLMRFEGDLGSSAFGVESLTNLDKFQQAGLALKDRSVVDFIYFGSQSTTNYRINNTPSWFKIDQEHLDFYQVTNITI